MWFGMKIIDSHTHLGSFPLFNVSLNADEMLEIMNQHDISISVVFSLPNELTLSAIKKYPNRLVGLVWVNPHNGVSASQEIDRAINEWNFKGIKMHPLIHSFLPDREIVYPILDKARKYRIPVLFHCGHPPWSLPWHFGNLAEVYPDVTIILGRMGHGNIVYINGAINIARKYDNIILETSAMPMHSKIKEAVERVSEDRVIYGSDMSFGHSAFEIKKIEVSGLSERQLELIFKRKLI